MASLQDYFSIQVFFIVLRETLELAIIISVLLAFVTKSLRQPASLRKEAAANAADARQQEDELRRLKIHIWVGGLCGFLVCLVVGAVILSVFYVVGTDLWASTEHYWEATFSIVASVIISVMGVKMLRVNRMQQKWKAKLGDIISRNNYLGQAAENAAWSERNAMFVLPFVTTLREGLEAIVFVGGIGINENTSVLLMVYSTVAAMAIGSCVGVALYRSGNTLSLQMFLISSSCFLYLVAAGLFSKGIWNFELQHFIDLCDGFDVSETGHGPGLYDIANSVWHVNCCNGELPDDGVAWMMFTAIFGWTNSATYGSVIGYNLYWATVIGVFWALLHEEKHGRLPLVPLLWQQRRIKKREYLLVGRASIDSTTPLQSGLTTA